MPERGKYIVIEGSDGTGKSTQVDLLNKRLNSIGIPTLVTAGPFGGVPEPISEPGGTARANELRTIIKDKRIERTPWQNVEWFTEARKSNWDELIEPALEQGIWVPTARNYYSTVAYQGYGEGIDVGAIEQFTEKEVGPAYMNPDFICVLALKDEVKRQKRIIGRSEDSRTDTFESMPVDFQTAMQNGYIHYAEERGVPVIDAERPRDAVQADIWEHVERLLS